MSQEYYSIENKSNLGELNIGLQVIEVIVKDTIDKVEGATLENSNALSMKNKGPVTVKSNASNQINIVIDIVIDYGMNVGTISTLIQDKVAQSLFEMLDLKNTKIDIEVQGINF